MVQFMLKNLCVSLVLSCVFCSPAIGQTTQSQQQQKWYEEPSVVVSITVFIASIVGGAGVYLGQTTKNNWSLQQRLETQAAIENAIRANVAQPLRNFEQKQQEHHEALLDIEKNLNEIVKEITTTLHGQNTEIIKLNKLMEYREEMGKLNIQRIDKIEHTVDNIRNALTVLHNRLETTRNFISAKHDDFSTTKRL